MKKNRKNIVIWTSIVVVVLIFIGYFSTWDTGITQIEDHLFRQKERAQKELEAQHSGKDCRISLRITSSYVLLPGIIVINYGRSGPLWTKAGSGYRSYYLWYVFGFIELKSERTWIA